MDVKLMRWIAGDGSAFKVAIRITGAGMAVLVSHVTVRLFLKTLGYQWRKNVLWSDLKDIPWALDGRGEEEREAYPHWKIMPVMMCFSLDMGLTKFLELGRNKQDGSVRPVVFSGASVGFHPTVILSDSKYFQELFTVTEMFPKYDTLYRLYNPILGKGLVRTAGEDHKKQRKLITPVFHFAALKSAMEIVERNALHFVETELPSENFIISQDTFKSFTMGVITDYAFSGAFDKKWMKSAWHSILRTFFVLNLFQIFIGSFVNYLPNPCNIYVFLVRWRIRRYLRRREAFLREQNITRDTLLKAVGAADEDAGGGSAAASKSDTATAPLSVELGFNLADQLLLAGCSKTRIIDECSTFLFAGEDTTGNLLAWAAHELSRRPDVQRRARDEIARVAGGPGPVRSISFESVKRLEYVTAILKEALRLWPPIPFLPRVNRRPGGWAVAGARVPCGAVIEYNLYAAHRDPAVFPEPDAFRPERWVLPAGAAEAALRHPHAFLPFIAGPRNCVGQKFAMQEATVMVAMLLSRFELRPARGSTGRVVPVIVVAMEPRGLAVECVPLPAA